MLDTYRAVLRTPGTARFCAAAFVMRMPIALYPIGLVLIVSARTGHYGFAGVLSGVYVIANGVGNPALARATDRLGQRRLLVPVSVAHVAAAVVAAVTVSAGWSDWLLAAATVVLGFTFLKMEIHKLSDIRRTTTAFAKRLVTSSRPGISLGGCITWTATFPSPFSCLERSSV